MKKVKMTQNTRKALLAQRHDVAIVPNAKEVNLESSQRPHATKKVTGPLSAIRAKCLDCSGWSPKEVELCPIGACPLYAYRFGKSPTRPKREPSEKQRAARQAAGERFRRAKQEKED